MNPLYREQFDYFEQKIKQYQSEGKSIFASSSFQSHSIPMIHIISQIDNSIPVYFLNTGYHFPETMAYRTQIAELLNLNVIDAKSPISKNLQREPDGRLYFASDPNHCCFLNKTLPMEPVLARHDIWITGVRRDQNANRSSFPYEAKGPQDTLRFHPMLDWNGKMIGTYINDFKIPRHPLEAKGYLNIGCSPCTAKYVDNGDGTGRGSRWAGMKKTECGLHTDLMAK
ncbi:MAG: phosphoadenosine phosphosulfate reductase [Arenicella sp.]|jgi:phosphoadenosine phosphosulfate reductase